MISRIAVSYRASYETQPTQPTRAMERTAVKYGKVGTGVSTLAKTSTRVAVNYGSAGTTEVTNKSGRVAVGYTSSGNKPVDSYTGSSINSRV